MEIIGERLTLRYPTAADAEALLALGSDPDVTRYFSWGPYRELAEPLAYVAALADERAQGVRMDLLVVQRGRGPAGIIGLSEMSVRDRRAVVGTWLGRDFWGTGVNREAKALIAHVAFEQLGLERLGAYADVDNPRSQAALTAIGFRQEGHLRRWHRHGDQVHDVLLYGWLREEFAASPLAAVPVRTLGTPPPAFVVGQSSYSGAG